MTMSLTETYISTVDTSRTIILPDSVPVGARVAIVLLPAEEVSDVHTSRAARFAAVLDAIRAAQEAGFTPPKLSDTEIDARVERVRHNASTGHRSSSSKPIR